MVGVIQDPSKLAAEGYVRLEPRCPLFDGEVAQQVEEWLDENVANSKASSTLKIIEDVPMYQSAWAKWEDWASTALHTLSQPHLPLSCSKQSKPIKKM